jgi:hypothetical protein
MSIDWIWGQLMFGVYVDRGQIHVCIGPLSLHRRRKKQSK